MTFAIVPDLLHGVELRGIGGELLHMQPWVTVLRRADRCSPGNRAAIPQEHDMPPQVAPQGPHEARPVNGLEVVGLEAHLPPQRLTLGGPREGHQGREAVMRIGVGDNRCGACRGPGAPSRGDEPKAPFIQAGQAGPGSRFQWVMACSSRWMGRRSGT
jgi:hypothetical protein